MNHGIIDCVCRLAIAILRSLSQARFAPVTCAVKKENLQKFPPATCMPCIFLLPPRHPRCSTSMFLSLSLQNNRCERMVQALVYVQASIVDMLFVVRCAHVPPRCPCACLLFVILGLVLYWHHGYIYQYYTGNVCAMPRLCLLWFFTTMQTHVARALPLQEQFTYVCTWPINLDSMCMCLWFGNYTKTILDCRHTCGLRVGQVSCNMVGY